MYIRVFVTPVVLLSKGVKIQLLRCTWKDNKCRINMIRLLNVRSLLRYDVAVLAELFYVL